MGTRSTTIFYDDEDKPLCAVYRQYDGYPDRHGLELAKLANKTIVNGYNHSQEDGKHANGMGDLAAQVIAGLKNSPHHKIGGIYMTSLDDRQQYVYHVRPSQVINYQQTQSRHVVITIDGVFSGTPQELIKKYSEDLVTNV